MSAQSVDLELSVTSAAAKSAVIAELRDRGFAAATGPVLLGFPFTVEVKAVDDAGVPGVEALAAALDAEAGLISTVVVGEPDPTPAGA